MHEPSIVEALLAEIRRQLAAHTGKKLNCVHVRVGALRQVVPEIMTNCFQVMTKDTELAGARLDLEQIPATAHCPKCSKTFPVEENWFVCPTCQTTEAKLQAGNELELTSLELTA